MSMSIEVLPDIDKEYEEERAFKSYVDQLSNDELTVLISRLQAIKSNRYKEEYDKDVKELCNMLNNFKIKYPHIDLLLECNCEHCDEVFDINVFDYNIIPKDFD